MTDTTNNIEIELIDKPNDTFGDVIDKINAAFEKIDDHDHSAEKGLEVPSGARNVNGDEDHDGNAILGVGYINLENRSVQITDANVLQQIENALRFTDSDGNTVSIVEDGLLIGITARFGQGEPASSLGSNGDIYFEQDTVDATVLTGEVYRKSNDTWASQGNNQGPSISDAAFSEDGSDIIFSYPSSSTLDDVTLTDAGTQLKGNEGPSGAATGALNLWAEGNAESLLIADFDSTNISAGTFTIPEVDAEDDATLDDLINPEKSFKLASLEDGDILISPDIPVPPGYRNGLLQLFFPYRSSEAENIIVKIYDASDDSSLLTSSALVNTSSDTRGSSVFNATFFVGDVDNINFVIEATGDVTQFIFDDVVITPDAFVTLPEKTYSREENNFGARIDNTGGNGATTVLGENVSFIESVNKTSTGTIDVVFNDNMFSVIPAVQVTAEGGSVGIDSNNAELHDVTTTGFTVEYIVQRGGLGGEVHTRENVGEFIISVQRQGDDYKADLVEDTTSTIITYNESIDRVVEYTADYVISSGDISITNITNQQKNGVATTWMSAVNDNGNSGQMDFSFLTSETGFTVIPDIQMIGSTETTATQGFIANSTASGFRYNGLSLVNANVSAITQSGRMVVRPSGVDVPKPIQTGTYITSPAQPIGTVVDSILTESQFNGVAPGNLGPM